MLEGPQRTESKRFGGWILLSGFVNFGFTGAPFLLGVTMAFANGVNYVL